MNAKVRAALDLKSKLLDRYADQIDGVLGCYDRLILTGTLVDVAHPDAACRPGCPFVCGCISTSISGWPINCAPPSSFLNWPTTPS